MNTEKFVADLAASFANAPADAIDGVVVDGLRRTVEALGLDGAFIWDSSLATAPGLPAYQWTAAGSIVPASAFTLIERPWIRSHLEAGEAVSFGRPDEISDPVERYAYHHAGPSACAVFPLPTPGQPDGGVSAAAFSSFTGARGWPAGTLAVLRSVVGIAAQALARRRAGDMLFSKQAELQQLRRRVTESGARVKRQRQLHHVGGPVLTGSQAIQRVMALIQQVAPTPATVLLLGETGTGKEVLAQAIHDMSPRRNRPMIKVSCAALPDTLIESELFGRERGAYTGADSRQIGRFEAAHKSTLFLDEIGELPTHVQVKVLRVLQERVIERLGSTVPIKLDVRIIAATNRNLEKAVEEKTFREDLFHRLNVFPIVVPPLRDRVEDIPALTWGFIDEFSRSLGKGIDTISQRFFQSFQHYAWPGNIRELRNVIERAVILSDGRHLDRDAIQAFLLGSDRIVRQGPAPGACLPRVMARAHGGAAERLMA
jgi:transcriptional regulator with GAF, ATPase, and Fis domain